MDKILINNKFYETRVAYLKDNSLFYYFNENKSEISIVGNIYKGKVTRVLPGLQSAFIDIGQDKAAFLHVSDLLYQHISRDDIEEPISDDIDISKLISVNDEILVQVSKDPISTKGPRIVTLLSIPGRFLVFFPIGNKIGISKKIDSEKERTRLKRIIDNYKPNDTAFIVRTAAKGVSSELIENDMRICMQQWINIVKKQKKLKAPYLLYEDLVLPLKVTRDMLNNNVSEMIIDDEAIYNKVIAFVDEFMPSQKHKVKLYDNNQVELFKRYNLENRIKKLDNKSAPLKSGGNIIIEQVEAMTVVDVNTGSFVGKNLQHDDTILRTNKEAMDAVAEQIRLRNIGGIIIVDFIDMKSDADKEILIKYAEIATKDDRANVTIHGVTRLGLMQITRKRISDSLRRSSTIMCSACNGRGSVKSYETITHEIYQEIIEKDKSYLKNKIIEVFVEAPLLQYINNNQSINIKKLKEQYFLNSFIFKKDNKLAHGEFNIVIKKKEVTEIHELSKEKVVKPIVKPANKPKDKTLKEVLEKTIKKVIEKENKKDDKNQNEKLIVKKTKTVKKAVKKAVKPKAKKTTVKKVVTKKTTTKKDIEKKDSPKVVKKTKLSDNKTDVDLKPEGGLNE